MKRPKTKIVEIHINFHSNNSNQWCIYSRAMESEEEEEDNSTHAIPSEELSAAVRELQLR
jgi:hypothetical protein